METRVAVLAIIVREGQNVAALNDLLHQYGSYIIGRMGVPYRQRGVNVISVAMDAPADVISARIRARAPPEAAPDRFRCRIFS